MVGVNESIPIPLPIPVACANGRAKIVRGDAARFLFEGLFEGLLVAIPLQL